MLHFKLGSAIGTDGNDRLDSSCCAAYSQWINSNMPVNFFAGEGDDVRFCDPVNDNEWSMAT